MGLISDDLAKEILRNISLSGSASIENAQTKPVIGKNLDTIITRNSGLPKVRSDVAAKFSLIVHQPLMLEAMSNFEIRCCLCKQVIGYPAWYWSKKYAVNHFHYFICFDASSPLKPTTKCYKRT